MSKLRQAKDILKLVVAFPAAVKDGIEINKVDQHVNSCDLKELDVMPRGRIEGEMIQSEIAPETPDTFRA